MRISDWSSDVCSSDLAAISGLDDQRLPHRIGEIGDEADAPRRIAAQAHLARQARKAPEHLTEHAPAVRLAHDKVGARLDRFGEIGRAHVCTTVTNAHLVCRLLLVTKQKARPNTRLNSHNYSLTSMPSYIAYNNTLNY